MNKAGEKHFFFVNIKLLLAVLFICFFFIPSNSKSAPDPCAGQLNSWCCDHGPGKDGASDMCSFVHACMGTLPPWDWDPSNDCHNADACWFTFFRLGGLVGDCCADVAPGMIPGCTASAPPGAGNLCVINDGTPQRYVINAAVCSLGTVNNNQGTCGEARVIEAAVMAGPWDPVSKTFSPPPKRAIWRDKYPGLTNKIVTCITDKVTEYVSTDKMTGIRNIVRKTVSVAVVLYLMIFGFRVMYRNLPRGLRTEAAVVVFTVVLVLVFINSNLMDTFVMRVTRDTQREIVNMVTSTVRIDSTTAGLGLNPLCDNANYNVWNRIDCIIAMFMGADPTVFNGVYDGDTRPPYGVPYYTYPPPTYTAPAPAPSVLDRPSARSIVEEPFSYGNRPWTLLIVAIVLGLIFAPGFIGIPMLILLGAFTLMMIITIVTAALIYLTSFIALVFLSMISPFIIPLALFSRTRQIFEEWTRQVIGYTIQPMFVFAYLAFIIGTIQFVLGHGGGAVSTTTPTDPTCTTDTDNANFYNCPNVYTGSTPGLVGQYTTIDKDNAFSGQSLMTTCSSTGPGSTDSCTDVRASNPGNNTGEFMVPRFSALGQYRTWNDYWKIVCPSCSNAKELTFDQIQTAISMAKSYNEAMNINNHTVNGFILTDLIFMTVIMSVAMMFLNNVVNIGSQITGVIGDQISKIANIYNKTADRVSKAVTQAVKTGVGGPGGGAMGGK